MSLIARSDLEDSLPWLLKICRILEENGSDLGPGEFHVLLAMYARRQQPYQVAQIIETMRRRGVPMSVTTYNLWIGSHVKCMDLFGALNAYNAMRRAGCRPNRDTYQQLIAVTFNQPTPCLLLLEQLAIHGDAVGADHVLQHMLDIDMPLTAEIFEKVLDAHQQHRDVAAVTRLYDFMLSKDIMPTLTIGLRMIVFMARMLNLDGAMRVFQHMRNAGVQPDVHCYTALIHAHGKRRHLKTAILLFEDMCKSGITPTYWTLNSLVRAYADSGKIDMALQVIDDILSSSSIIPNQYTFRPLLCRYASSGRMDEVARILEFMRERGVKVGNTSISAVMKAYLDDGKTEDAHAVLDMAIEKGLKPHTQTYNLLLLGYSREPNLMGALRVLQDMMKHGVEANKTSYDMLIRLFSRLTDPKAAVKVLNEAVTAGEIPDELSYAPLMFAYAAAKDVENVERIFRVMLNSKINPSTISYNVMVHAYAINDDMPRALRIYTEMVANGIEPDEVTYNTLICRLVDIGAVGDAEKIFNQARRVLRSARAYNALINAYMRQGDHAASRRIYNEMLMNGISPDGLTYTLLMHAYATGGDAYGARLVMDDMRSRGFASDIVHYTAMFRAYALVRNPIAVADLRREMAAEGVEMDKVAWIWLLRAFTYTPKLLWDAWYEMLSRQQATPLAFSIIVNRCALSNPMAVRVFEEWAKARQYGVFDTRNYNQLATVLAKRGMLDKACTVLEALHQDKPEGYVEGGAKYTNVWSWTARALLTSLSEYHKKHSDIEAGQMLERLMRVAPEIETVLEDEESIRQATAGMPKKHGIDLRKHKPAAVYRDVKLPKSN
jgi:pentatricopeptide repeat protein